MARDARSSSSRCDSIDLGLIAASVLAFALVAPIGLMFRRPFWVDEAWVADLVKIPLSRQITLSSSTPVGWALLLRLVPGNAPQRLRAVPLVFSAAGVVFAYLLARGLNGRSLTEARAAGVVAAAAVVLAPASLQQSDLKQYSADAALALLVLLLARDAEQRPGRGGLVKLAAASALAVPFSSAAVFVAVAAFGGLLGAAALERRWQRAREIVFAGIGAGVAIGAYVLLVVLPHENTSLRNYWRPFYLDGSPSHIVSTVGHRFLALGPSFGLAPKLVLVLVAVGLVALVVRRNTATAVAVVLLWLEMVVLGVADRYPFLDTRTSHFLLIVTVVIAAVGFSEIANALGRWRTALLPVVVVVTIAVLAVGVRHQMRTFAYPGEDPRTPTIFVARHRAAGDIIVVNLLANWGFTYYWPGGGTRVFTSRDTVASAYLARVDGIDAVFAAGRGPADVLTTLKTALARRRALGGHGRIWIVRTHVLGGEAAAWTRAFAELRLRPVAVTGGPEPLLRVDP